jgi:uncharacterized protein (TIGR02246 family)
MTHEPQVPEFFQEYSSQSEAAIRALLNEFAEAIRSGDATRILSFYSDDVVAFDMMPPLQFKSKSAYQTQAWEECFTNFFEFPVDFEYHDLRVHADGDVAFSHSLVHMKGKAKSGEVMESWLRNTTCLQRMDGHWQITHEHNSVPLDKETGAGLMDLAP